MKIAHALVLPWLVGARTKAPDRRERLTAWLMHLKVMKTTADREAAYRLCGAVEVDDTFTLATTVLKSSRLTYFNPK